MQMPFSLTSHSSFSIYTPIIFTHLKLSICFSFFSKFFTLTNLQPWRCCNTPYTYGHFPNKHLKFQSLKFAPKLTLGCIVSNCGTQASLENQEKQYHNLPYCLHEKAAAASHDLLFHLLPESILQALPHFRAGRTLAEVSVSISTAFGFST